MRLHILFFSIINQSIMEIRALWFPDCSRIASYVAMSPLFGVIIAISFDSMKITKYNEGKVDFENLLKTSRTSG